MWFGFGVHCSGVVMPPQPKSPLLQQLQSNMRLRQMSPRTIEAYTAWVLRFVRFHRLRHPVEMGDAKVRSSLTWLVERRRVSPSTRGQALQTRRCKVQPSENNKWNRVSKWIRWFLLSEGLILFLAFAGPGTRYRHDQRNSHDLLARFVVEDPTYIEAVVVNVVVVHLFIGCAFLAAWVFTRWRQEG